MNPKIHSSCVSYLYRRVRKIGSERLVFGSILDAPAMVVMPTRQELQLAWRVLNWIHANGVVRKEDAFALRCATLGNRLRPLDEIAKEIIQAAQSKEDPRIRN